MIRLAALLAGVLCLGTPAAAHVYDHLYGNGFDTPADAPGSDAEAARFLTQATFGPTACVVRVDPQRWSRASSPPRRAFHSSISSVARVSTP